MTAADTSAVVAIELAAKELRLAVVRRDAEELADDAQRSKLS